MSACWESVVPRMIHDARSSTKLRHRISSIMVHGWCNGWRGNQLKLAGESSSKALGLLGGGVGCVLAYGQTGAGKSYTMMGDMDDDQKKGIIPRIMEQIFDSILVHGSSQIEYTVGISYLEIYMERIRDLLNPMMDNLPIHEGSRGPFVKGLREIYVNQVQKILDTLKEGLAELRADLDKLKSANGTAILPKGGEIVLADGGDIAQARDIPVGHSTTGAPLAAGMSEADFQKMEVLFAQLQIKIEAMDSTLHDIPAMKPSQAAEGTAMRDDVIALEAILREMQDSISAIANKDTAVPSEGVARKEDTDAIETLLRNTKDKLEEAFPDPDRAVNKDHLDAVEAVVRITNETMAQ